MIRRSLRVIDDRKRLLRRLAEPVERGAEIVARQQERSRLRDQLAHGLVRLGAICQARLARIDDAAEPAAAVDDEDLLWCCPPESAGAARRAGSSAAMTAGSRRIIGPISSSLIQPTSSGLRIAQTAQDGSARSRRNSRTNDAPRSPR